MQGKGRGRGPPPRRSGTSSRPRGPNQPGGYAQQRQHAQYPQYKEEKLPLCEHITEACCKAYNKRMRDSSQVGMSGGGRFTGLDHLHGDQAGQKGTEISRFSDKYRF